MRRKHLTPINLLFAILIVALIFFLLEFAIKKAKVVIAYKHSLNVCQLNLRELGIALREYSENFNGSYPTPNKWCDLLIESNCIDKYKLCCSEMGYEIRSSLSPIDVNSIPAETVFIEDYNDDKGRKKYLYRILWSYYGLNPNTEPNSASDVVLLFETEHGWNQFGGPNLVGLKSDVDIYGKEGCNILFNDGTVRFVKPKDIPKLNWGKGN